MPVLSAPRDHASAARPARRAHPGLALLLGLVAACGGEEIAGPQPPSCLETLQPLAGRWAGAGDGLSVTLTFTLARAVVNNLFTPGTHIEDVLDVEGQLDHSDDALDTAVSGRIYCIILATHLRPTAPPERASPSPIAHVEIVATGPHSMTVRLRPAQPWYGNVNPVATEMLLSLQRQP